MGLILLIILILLMLGGLPTWNHSHNWGYGPSGLLSVVLLVLIVLMLFGHVPRCFLIGQDRPTDMVTELCLTIFLLRA